MKWVKHPVVEQNLRQLGIKFDVEQNIPLSKIDLEEGKRKQVRMGVDPDVMLRYALKMQEDTAWNMVVLQKERNRYWPWSGNQRMGAFALSEVGQTVDAAYVVELFDPVMMELLPRVVNTWEAVTGMTKEEAVFNARYMHEKHGMAVAEVAKVFGLKQEAVYKSVRIEQSKTKLEKMSVSTADMAPTTLENLGRIENINAMKKAAHTLQKYKVKGTDALALINDVRQGKTEAQQIVTIEKWEHAFEQRKPTSAPNRRDAVKLPHKELNRERLVKILTSLQRFCDQNKTITQMQLTDPVQFQLVRGLWRSISPVMEDIIKEGAKK